MEIDLTPYILTLTGIRWRGMMMTKHPQWDRLMKDLPRKWKRASDDEDRFETKRRKRELLLIDDEELRRKLHYPNEDPSRWENCGQEVEVIDLTTSD